MVKKARRMRTRCKICKKRVNLKYSISYGKIRFFCPNCCGHGELIYK